MTESLDHKLTASDDEGKGIADVASQQVSTGAAFLRVEVPRVTFKIGMKNAFRAVGLRTTVIMLVAGALTVLPAIFFRFRPTYTAAPLAIAAMLAIFIPWLNRLKRHANEVANGTETDIRQIVLQLAGLPDVGPSPLIFRQAMPRLVERGYSGLGIGVIPPDEVFNTGALDISFEPREINASDISFRELQAAQRADGDLQSTNAPSSDHGTERDSLHDSNRRSSRNATRRSQRGRHFYIRIFTVLVILGQMPGLIRGSIAFMRTGNAPVDLLLPIGSLLFLGIVFRRSIFHLTCWYLAPQQLILRHSMRAPGKRLDIFERSRSLLIIMPSVNKLWFVCLCNGPTVEYFTVTQTEAEIIAAAWMSASPPVPRDKLSDLE